MALYNNILETIGNTPLVRLEKIEKKFNIKSNIYAKLESFNPANNVKTRPAFYMIKDLYERKVIDSSYKLIESTSGNTGIGIAMIGAFYGNEVIITMPDSVSKERIDVLKHYGAKVVLTPGELGINGSNDLAKELLKKEEKAIQPSQFSNEKNPLSHYQTTARELERDLENIDYIFATVGTGGTVTGIGKYFKEKGLETKIIAIEPANSPVLSKGIKGPHKIQGIGPGFIPEIFNYNFIDEIITVGDEEAYELTKLIPKIEGISAGISSGACLKAAINYLSEHKIINKNIVVIFPDSGEKYFSTNVFE
jgi:cysteine synthase A